MSTSQVVDVDGLVLEIKQKTSRSSELRESVSRAVFQLTGMRSLFQMGMSRSIPDEVKADVCCRILGWVEAGEFPDELEQIWPRETEGVAEGKPLLHPKGFTDEQRDEIHRCVNACEKRIGGKVNDMAKRLAIDPHEIEEAATMSALGSLRAVLVEVVGKIEEIIRQEGRVEE